MELKYWTVYYYKDGWISDGFIPCPISEFTEDGQGTTSFPLLADSSKGVYTPENKQLKGRIVWNWPRRIVEATQDKSCDIFRKMRDYVGSGAGIKIITHTSGAGLSNPKEFKGYPVRWQKIWLPGDKVQKYNLIVDFEEMAPDGIES